MPGYYWQPPLPWRLRLATAWRVQRARWKTGAMFPGFDWKVWLLMVLVIVIIGVFLLYSVQ